MAAILAWKLGDHCGKVSRKLASQDIDLAWHGNPCHSQRLGGHEHVSKITIYGDDCADVAARIVRLLNEEDAKARQPDRSDEAETDRAMILMTMNLMGSMAQAGQYSILGIDYGREDFAAALRDASRSQLDQLLAKTQPYQGKA